MLPSERGEFDRAARELRRLAARNFADVARRYTWVFSLMFAAETAANLGDASVASTLLELLEPLSGRLMVAEHLRAGPVDRVLGRLCTAIGSYDRAAAYLSTSAELTRRAGAPLWATRTRLDMARLAQARGDRTGARAAAEQARDMALRFGATGLAQQAERLLSAC
jgi:ATP/maltotriose-dependent transcriptional regulator MalT